MTIDLEHSQVFRAGVTASVLQSETRTITLEPNTSERVLDFRFRMGAAGGGKTSILLRVGLDDFPAVATALNTIRTLELSRLRARNADLAKIVASYNNQTAELLRLRAKVAELEKEKVKII